MTQILTKYLKNALGTACILVGAQGSWAQHGPKSTGSEGFAPPKSAVSKGPCKDEKECATEVKLWNGTVVGSVVSRNVSDAGIVEEYVKDNASQLTWSPQSTTGGSKDNGQMTQAEAKDYCESKKDLGLSWTLPSQEDFKLAFYPDNPSSMKFPSNSRLVDALGAKDCFLCIWWSSHIVPSTGSGRGFDTHKRGLQTVGRDMEISVRCVGR